VLAAAIACAPARWPHKAQKPASPAPAAAAAAPRDFNKVVYTYCGDCHDDARKRGGVSFDHFDVTKAGDNSELTEKMIRKLQLGMMPPPGEERPDPGDLRGIHRGARSAV
jgi:cytochrome c553